MNVLWYLIIVLISISMVTEKNGFAPSDEQFPKYPKLKGKWGSIKKGGNFINLYWMNIQSKEI